MAAKTYVRAGEKRRLEAPPRPPRAKKAAGPANPPPLEPLEPPRYEIEGPLEERREIQTPWGAAWAEEGMYVATNADTGAMHIVHPEDFPRLYEPA